VTAIPDRALVLRTWEFSETSQTVSLFTLQHGAIRGLAKGARRERSTFGGGFEPLTLGSVAFRIRTASELALVTEWKVEEIFWAPRTDLGAHRAGLYASELIGAFITDREAHEGLFHTAVGFLRMIEDRARISEALIALQWSVLVETGHRPRIDPGPAETSKDRILGFDPEAGMIVPDPGPDGPSRPSHIWRIRRETVEVLRRLETDPEGFEAPGPVLERTARFLAAWCRHHLGRELQTAASMFGRNLGDTVR